MRAALRIVSLEKKTNPSSRQHRPHCVQEKENETFFILSRRIDRGRDILLLKTIANKTATVLSQFQSLFSRSGSGKLVKVPDKRHKPLHIFIAIAPHIFHFHTNERVR